MSSKLKLLAWAPGAYFGGCESYVAFICSAAAEKGWNVRIFCGSEECRFGMRQATANNLDCLVIRPVWFERRLPQTWQHILQQLHIRFLLARYRPDVVLAALPWHDHGKELFDACVSTHTKLVVTYQLVAPGFPPSDKVAGSVRTAIMLAGARLIAVSENNRQLLASYYGIPSQRISLIPNRAPPLQSTTIDLCSVSELRKKLKLPEEAMIFLTIGGLRRQKGYDVLLQAMPLILRKVPNAFFAWLGEGELRGFLEQEIQRGGLERFVKLAGQRSDVGHWLAAADFFLFPTRYEGESFALMEAILAKCPVLVSRASGIPELLRNGIDAILFDVGDTDAIAEAVCWAAENSVAAEKMASSAFQRLNEYTAKDMVADTLAVLTAAAHNGDESRLQLSAP